MQCNLSKFKNRALRWKNIIVDKNICHGVLYRFHLESWSFSQKLFDIKFYMWVCIAYSRIIQMLCRLNATLLIDDIIKHTLQLV